MVSVFWALAFWTVSFSGFMVYSPEIPVVLAACAAAGSKVTSILSA